MPIPIPDPTPYTVPPSSGFTPDRLGVRRVVLDADRASNAYRVNITPCPATAEAWGPVDAPDLSSGDLVAELLAAPDTPERTAVLGALQRMQSDVVTVAGYLLALRAAPPEEPPPEE